MTTSARHALKRKGQSMSAIQSKQAPGYYIRFRGQTTGPYTLSQVQASIAQGSISRIHDISRDQVNWFPIHTNPAILRDPAPNMASRPAPAGPTPSAPSRPDVMSNDASESQPITESPQPQGDSQQSSDAQAQDIIESILREPRK